MGFDMLDIEIGDITDIDLGVFGFEDEPEEPEAEEDDYQVQLLEDTITKPGRHLSTGRSSLDLRGQH